MLSSRSKSIAVCLTLCAMVLLWAAPAQCKDEQTWYVEALLYGWLAGADGTVEAGHASADVDADFTDLLEHVDGALGGRLEGGYKDFAAMADVYYLNASSDLNFPGGKFTGGAQMKQWLFDFGLYYLAFGHRPLMKDGWSFGIEPFVGGRYVNIQKASFVNGPFSLNANSKTDWIDPLLGLRLSADLIGNLFTQIEGQIGGFHTGSDLTWTAQGAIGYGFFQTAVLSVGYKAVSYDYDNDKTGFAYRGLNLVTHGPVVAMGVHF